MRYFLTLIIFCSFLFSRAGDVVKYGELFFEIDEDSKTAKVTYNQDEKRYSFSHVDIPEVIVIENIEYAVTTIGDHAFARCENLKTITIPPTVKRLENYCFIFSGLTSISFPDSIEYMGILIFQDCHELSGEIILPKSNDDVPDGCFYNCEKITSVVIPPAVKAIYPDAFYGCTSLQKIEISDLESWFNINFSIDLRNNNPLQYVHHLYLNGEELTNLEIPESVTEIRNYAFYGCTDLKSVKFNKNVTKIGTDAFTGTGLEKVEISDLESWLKISFNNQKDNPLFLAHRLFFNGKELRDLEIPESITQINKYAFFTCSSIEKVFFPEGLKTISPYSFYNCTGIREISFSNSITSIGNYAFNGCTSLTSLAFPFSITDLGENVFSGCNNLKRVILPPITVISAGAFENCISLEEVVLPNTIKAIRSNAFYKCKSLKEVVIPPSTESVYAYAFQNCESLEKISAGFNLKYIGKDAFGTAQTMMLASNFPPFLDTPTFNDFSACLFVIPQAEFLYKEAEQWMNFTDIRTLNVPDELVVNRSSISGYKGDKILINAALVPSKGTTLENVFFTTDNPDVATVDYNGVVTITGESGECTIKCQSMYAGVNSAYIPVKSLGNNLQSGISDVAKEDSMGSYPAIVYNLQGLPVMTIQTPEELCSLPEGMYIVNGKKFMNRK